MFLDISKLKVENKQITLEKTDLWKNDLCPLNIIYKFWTSMGFILVVTKFVMQFTPCFENVVSDVWLIVCFCPQQYFDTVNKLCRIWGTKIVLLEDF